MYEVQIHRVIVSLAELFAQGISVHSINTEYREGLPDDVKFKEPIVSIKYQRDDQKSEHEVRVYCDGSASDF